MTYKTILVHVDESKSAIRRTQVAHQIGNMFDAHITGVAWHILLFMLRHMSLNCRSQTRTSWHVYQKAKLIRSVFAPVEVLRGCSNLICNLLSNLICNLI